MMQHELSARLRAAGPPPSVGHLRNPDLITRLMSTDVVIADSRDDAEPVKRTRQRKPSFASVTRLLKRAGVEVAGYEVRPDGTVIVRTGKPVDASDSDSDDTKSPDPRWN